MHPWNESRINTERELIKKYGLKSHREVWKAKTYLGKHRQQARELLAKIGTANPQIKKESDQLLVHLTRMGILTTGASLDDVLALETESILSRRLQTVVYLKGFSATPNQARQLINHGHIAVNNRKITIPSYMVSKDEESQIQYTIRSPLNELSHPARPKVDMYKTEMGMPQKSSIQEKQIPTAPSQEGTTSSPVAPSEQPPSVAEAPQKPTEPPQTPVEEKPVNQTVKQKETAKKEKKTEEGA